MPPTGVIRLGPAGKPGSAQAGRSADAAPTRRHKQRRRFSTLTLRILAPNLVALGVLVGGIFYLDQYRDGLLEERIASLQLQAEIMAGALGESAVRGPAGGRALDPALSRNMVSRLVVPTRTRARIYDADGRVVADSRDLIAAGRMVVLRRLPPEEHDGQAMALLERAYDWLMPRLPKSDRFPPYVERPGQGSEAYREVGEALTGTVGGAIRTLGNGSLVLTVAVPIQPLRRVVGALLLSTDSNDIEQRVRETRIAILQVSALALAVTVLLSVFLAGTIARPLRRLANAADRIRQWRGRRPEIPDLTRRQDEIGELSAVLGEMTHALYARMDAIEAFAADVAHEIKNPLSSLRSALETVARSEDPADRERLLAVMAQDVRRLDRLISDITNASRIDAEMARAATESVDLAELLRTIAELYEDRLLPSGLAIDLDLPEGETFEVEGVAGRLGQVVDNLVSNAVSFSPKGGRIRLALRHDGDMVELVVEDDGPGIQPGREEMIFERFHTQRPGGEGFGRHSGLGLSICRQITDAHAGSIRAENRRDAFDVVLGARFVVRLPA